LKAKKILFQAGTIFYFGPLHHFLTAVRKCLNVVRSGYISAGFAKRGDSIYFHFPVRLIGAKYISVGDRFSALGRLRLEAYDNFKGQEFYPRITIGNNVVMNTDCHIACIDSVTIGNFVLFASRIFITDHYHGSIDRESLGLPPAERGLYSKGPVVIEDNVWIGEGVSIMPGVRIGENSIIGANAVVTRSFGPNSVIGGVPARLIKTN
jgi:acetyltransferase-like isoleucine patch superfamily enzyme